MIERRLLASAVLCLVGEGAAAAMPADIAQSLSAPSMVHAQRPGDLLSEQIATLTLLEALYLGLRNNRAIRGAYLRRVAEKFDLRVAKGAFHPKLTMSSSYLRNRGSDNRSEQLALEPSVQLLGQYGTQFSLAWSSMRTDADMAGRSRRDGIDLGIVQPLLRGAGREVTTAPLRLAELAEQLNRLALKTNVTQVVTDIIGSYRALLRSQEQLALSIQSLGRARELLSINEALIEAGRMAAFEVVQTRADIAVQELQVEEDRNRLDTDRLALLSLLALDIGSRVVASDTLQIAHSSIDTQEALRLAQSQHPAYLATVLESQRADLNLILAKDQGRWDVSLLAGANQTRDQEGNIDPTRRWESYAGVKLDIPIDNLPARQARVQAHVEVQNQLLLQAEARQALERSVTEGVRDMGVRWRQYQLAVQAVELTRQKLAIEHDKLGVGRSSNFQVLSFDSDLRQADNTLLTAKIAYLDAQTQLDQTLGTTLDRWEITLNDH